MATPCDEKRWWINSGRMGWKEPSSTQRALKIDTNCKESRVPPRRSIIQDINRGKYDHNK